MINDLFIAARSRLNIETNAELGRRLGVQRAFMCNIQAGRKSLPDAMRTKLAALCGWLPDEVDALLTKGSPDVPLPRVSEVQRSLQHESGVLQDSASGDRPGVAEERGSDQRQAAAGQGRSEPADLLGERGEGPVPRLPRQEKLKRGTRAAVVLVAGRTYYPDKASDHSHRRIISLVRRPNQPTAVVYSIGGDNNLVCDRNTFIRWMDPTRYHDGKTEVRIPAAGAAEDQQQPQAKRVRKARAAQAVAG